jgi:hypothetical protein
MMSLDMTHLIVAIAALVVPIVLRRLQALAAPQSPSPVPPSAAPAIPADLAALLPLHGLLLQAALQALQQHTAAPQQQPPK